MTLPILILGTIPGYLAAGLSLSMGASWLAALLTLSLVGVVCTLILAGLVASTPRGPKAPRAMGVAATAR